ncbi:hypothetical protein T440DRAFT_500821 [Plenodomus tracheiphilus IPT5]|uniref:Uncharacterized protein n=1 Tax=Plenodomus tracheiphilus IPT5 TaxID=1408161 RepID=A0A6A7AX64_9PLEO|nr:hypothetical protein T440DRAFT_500821 [Plenodomus tracheiphilus IPT5]
MDYYHCSSEDLHQEIRRRGHSPTGTIDALSEGLQADDESRGTHATTVTTENVGYLVTQFLDLPSTPGYEQLARAGSLINQKIVYWTTNTFFPSLQLFFQSGLSCTIDAVCIPDATTGLDEDLRFRLTDLTHEENGRIIKTRRSAKSAHTAGSLVIREAVIARRTSTAIQFYPPDDKPLVPSSATNKASAKIINEQHIVVGLRIEGMSKMAYVWARVGDLSKGRGTTWVGVGISKLRYDVPIPFRGDPRPDMKPGSEATVFLKDVSICALDRGVIQGMYSIAMINPSARASRIDMRLNLLMSLAVH